MKYNIFFKTMQGSILTINNVIDSYKMLESENAEARSQANQFLMSIVTRDEAWSLAKEMITNTTDVKYQFIGAQVLYQKIRKQINQLSLDGKQQLREFVFTQLNQPTLKFNALIDKLASSGALLGCVMCIEEWKTFIPDMINFMKNSPDHLKKGLYVLERIPEELRSTNRFSSSHKHLIMKQLLQHQEQIVLVFANVLTLNDESLTSINLQAVESWVKSGFNLFNHTELFKNVLLIGLQHESVFQFSVNVVLETIKGTCMNKSQSLSEMQPSTQLQSFSSDELNSIKLLLEYIVENENNFLHSQISAEYKEIYLDILKETLLHFTFLLLEQVFPKLVNIILSVASSSDLKLSSSTFQFWIDFSEKVIKIKTLPSEVKNSVWNVYLQLFSIVNRKVVVEGDYLLDDPDLKEDVTIDDINQMTFSEYRKESTTLYKFLYDYFLAASQEPTFYFQQIFSLINKDGEGTPNKYTQLALFCLRAAIESMISPIDRENIRKIVKYLVSIHKMPARVVGQTMSLIRDCTRQIRGDEAIFMECLKFTLNYIEDEKLCHHASYCFQILMESMGVFKDPYVVDHLISFYHSKSFPKDLIVEQILQGIVAAIVKIPDFSHIESCLNKLVKELYKKFSTIVDEEKKSPQNLPDHPYVMALLELKVLLTTYETGEEKFKKKFHSFFEALARESLKILEHILPFCIEKNLTILSYNELGLSVVIYKNILKICGVMMPDNYLKVIQLSLMNLNEQVIVEKYSFVHFLADTLLVFSGKQIPSMTAWAEANMGPLNHYFITNYQNLDMVDPDIIKWFFSTQECILLYNPNIFLKVGMSEKIIEMALFSLRHVNQKNMQRKIINFLFLVSQLQHDIIRSWHIRIIQTVFNSIPIIYSMWYQQVVRILFILCRSVSNPMELFEKLLGRSPYQDFPINLRNIFIDMIIKVIQSHNERYLKEIFKDLSEMARVQVAPYMVSEIQIRYCLWKKQLKP